MLCRFPSWYTLTTMTQLPRRKRPNPLFFCSAASAGDFPPPQGEEYAVFGRSNVGKSSFINHALERGGLARTSRTPGKTALANFFRVDETMVWVDLPGYGYARTSLSERDRWSKLIRDYCEGRENLMGIIWLIDIRHPGAGADLEARRWIGRLALPALPVLTKGDKVSRGQETAQGRKAVEALRLPEEPVIYSVRRHASRELFWKRFERWRGIHKGRRR
ncbi:MAG: ribosome biogenesis GTP-binding protein YsxC [Chitinispirillaceae bacterium]|nr:ribosome biogenesis GTP-binding protein YsxC [Chitinispirillaceae bacterium]